MQNLFYIVMLFIWLGMGCSEEPGSGQLEAEQGMDAMTMADALAVDGALPDSADAENEASDMGTSDGGNTPVDGEVTETDAAQVADAMTEVDGSIGDMGQEPEWGWSWGDCRLALLAETLSDEDQALCDEHFTARPDAARLGLHWIFVGHDAQTAETYPASQLGDLNSVFEANQMSFFNASMTRIIDPVVTEGGRGTTRYPLRDLAPDLAQHLGIESDDPEEVFAAFQERQRAVGVATRPGLGQRPLNLDSTWTSAQFYKHVARLYPQLVTVIVRDNMGEKSTGNYPGINFAGATADVIFLTEPGALSALPHEMGHFFGLLHTHGIWDRQPGGTQAWALAVLQGIDEDDWNNLEDLAGAEFDSDFSDVYLPYDCSEDELLAFESGQITGRKVLGWSDFTYVGDFESVANDAQFVALIRAGNPPMMKNFVRSTENGSFSGNNCGKSYVGDDRRTLRCKYGDGQDGPASVRLADDPLVGGSVLFAEDSSESNLMSYISTDISDGIRRKIHLTERQRELINLGFAMPSRQRLRNFALAP